MNNLTPTDIVNDANWHLCSLELATYTAKFAYVPRQVIDSTPFLDARFFSQYQGNFVDVDLRHFARYPFEQLNIAPVHYIFHTAFCGSTLLSRCFNQTGVSLSLSEPEVLLQLAHFKRNYPDFTKQDDWQKILKTVINLLARPHTQGEHIVIKPTNSANNLIADLLALDSQSKGIFLRSSLSSFLVSNIKKGDGYRAFCQLLIKCFAMDSDYLSEHNLEQYQTLDGLTSACLAWHMQQHHFNEVISGAGNQQSLALTVDQLLSDPSVTLTRAIEFLSLPFNAEQIAAILQGKAFNTHSKNSGESYGLTKKQDEDQMIKLKFQDEISQAMLWANTHCHAEQYPYFKA